jgi:hypothetical protein
MTKPKRPSGKCKKATGNPKKQMMEETKKKQRLLADVAILF